MKILLVALLAGCASAPVPPTDAIPDAVPVAACLKVIGKLKDAGDALARELDRAREQRDTAIDRETECAAGRST